ncbi:hypothetical protein NX059_010924 [Plenodomus lindquistii]|nr:hypothetical protein NX059_010924 [Plenodomus lindquistii]
MNSKEDAADETTAFVSELSKRSRGLYLIGPWLIMAGPTAAHNGLGTNVKQDSAQFCSVIEFNFNNTKDLTV